MLRSQHRCFPASNSDASALVVFPRWLSEMAEDRLKLATGLVRYAPVSYRQILDAMEKRSLAVPLKAEVKDESSLMVQ